MWSMRSPSAKGSHWGIALMYSAPGRGRLAPWGTSRLATRWLARCARGLRRATRGGGLRRGRAGRCRRRRSRLAAQAGWQDVGSLWRDVDWPRRCGHRDLGDTDSAALLAYQREGRGAAPIGEDVISGVCGAALAVDAEGGDQRPVGALAAA